jgi:hypothetical protein
VRLRTKSKGQLTLSAEKSTPPANIEDYAVWVYGPPKIGKTTFTAMFSDCHHFMFEAGAKAVRVNQRLVQSWPDWLEYQRLWAASKFVTATVDVVEIAYEMCFQHTCRELGIEHPADQNDMGKSWGRIRQAFMQSMQFMQQQPGKGCVFVSHASATKRKTADGGEAEDVHPALTGKPMEALAGSMDVIGYMHTRRGRRVMQIRGDDQVMAGCRLEENFVHTDGTPVAYVPLGTSKEEAYANFMRAFRNELPPEEVAFVTEKKKPAFRLKSKK